MKKLLCRAYGVALLVCCLCAPIAQASVIIDGTRVVFPAKDGEVTVRMTNDSSHPVLIEAWIDNGDPHSTPDKVDVPFLLTPPLFRMEAHRDQSLRVIATPAAASLPGDRESLFWLNVLEIPPKPSGPEFQGKSTLQFAIRSRLKFFYRPAGLPGDPDKAADQMIWTVVKTESESALEVHNPSPYQITILNLKLDGSERAFPLGPGMASPLGTLRFALKGLPKVPLAHLSIAYDSIDDNGATVAHQVTVTP